MPELQTRKEYISEIQETLAVLERFLAEIKKLPHLNTQGLLSFYFADRARKIGNACLRILDLDAPLAILCRVLCEDFINLYWATLSPENANYYSRRSISEMGKVTKHLISRVIEEKKNKGENLEINIDFDKLAPKVKTKTLKDMAKEAGLGALYDHVYRSESMNVHGHNWGIFQIELKNMDLLLLSQISTLLVVMVGLFNRGHRVITPKEILSQFGLES